MKNKLKKCFSHMKVSPIFSHHLIVILLVVHLILGFRRLREIDYYRDDPLILRLMGLKKLLDVSTISRSLSQMDTQSIDNLRMLSRSFVMNALQREQFYRLTLDFDGSVLSTKRHAQGSAIGYNKIKKPQKGPLQLDLFEPLDLNYEYKVIVTNKTESAKSVVLFHNGRGSQESIFGDAKTDTALGVIPCKRLSSNQVFTLASMMAHNFSREIQMVAHPVVTRAKPKRPSAWKFKKLDTIRHQIIQRAGRLTRPQGKLTLTMSPNPAVRKDLLHFMDVLQNAA